MRLAKIDSSKENTSRHLRKSFKTTFGSVFIRSAIFRKCFGENLLQVLLQEVLQVIFQLFKNDF